MKVAVGMRRGTERTGTEAGYRTLHPEERTPMSARHFPIGRLLLVGSLVAALPAAAGVLSGNCRVASQPAATLLFPYFEADLANPTGQTTLLSINNASSKPV